MDAKSCRPYLARCRPVPCSVCSDTAKGAQANETVKAGGSQHPKQLQEWPQTSTLQDFSNRPMATIEKSGAANWWTLHRLGKMLKSATKLLPQLDPSRGSSSSCPCGQEAKLEVKVQEGHLTCTKFLDLFLPWLVAIKSIN